MFAHRSVDGEGVRDEGGLDTSKQSLERLRDLLMIRLRRKAKLTMREVAVVMNCDHSTVVRRIRSVPPRLRERYETSEMGRIL